MNVVEYMESPRGVKSRFFGCFWQSMFLAAMVFPKTKPNKDIVKKFKRYYDSFKFILPCKFCRDFIKEKLEKDIPLDFSGRIGLIRSIYMWKDAVNKKLIAQGCKKTKPSPSFEVILMRLEKMYATCSPKVGMCV